MRLLVSVVIVAVDAGIALDHLSPVDVPGVSLPRHGSATVHRHDRIAEAGIERGPHQHLHAAERAAGDRSQMCNAQMIEDDLLGVDHVLDRRPGISRSVWMTAVWIDRGRRGGSEARA